jgi:hypothetical protein
MEGVMREIQLIFHEHKRGYNRCANLSRHVLSSPCHNQTHSEDFAFWNNVFTYGLHLNTDRKQEYGTSVNENHMLQVTMVSGLTWDGPWRQSSSFNI